MWRSRLDHKQSTQKIVKFAFYDMLGLCKHASDLLDKGKVSFRFIDLNIEILIYVVV